MDPKLPNVDVFLNPAKKGLKEEVVKEKKEIAENYFNSVNMQSLYPELFRILWESTLPCFGTPEKGEHMLSSCQLAGSEVNCSDLFTKVPTDIGMCCALGIKDSLKDSTYQQLVKELQEDETTTGKTEVKSKVGQRNGLRLTLDLHSNTVSFGTLDQEYNAFSVFIGHPAEFPMLRERSLKLQPGLEHFIDLSAVVVSANDIKDISPEARECFFADEGNLDFYKNYTFSNCRLECAINKSEEIFNCVPWHLPRVRNFVPLLNAEILSFRGRPQVLATLGLPGTSLLTWERRPRIAPNVDQIASLQPIQQLLPPRNSGSPSGSFLSIFSRLCDSRNLNMSPFCNLTASSLAKWQPALKTTYGNTTTDYTTKLSGPLRLKYPSTPEKELLVSLTQVFLQNAHFHY